MRRLRSENDVTEEHQESPPEGNTDPEVAERANPKELLSFAWQISKGMEYLAETKV